MGKTGVIADIHSNLTTLKKALGILEAASVDRVVVCGDIVGYGSFPNECCAEIRALGCPVVAGNHDWAVAGLTEYRSTHSVIATKSIELTKEVISEDNLRWLQNLPLHHRENGVEFVHASLSQSEKWHYLSPRRLVTRPFRQDVRKSFSALKEKICFVGHSHRAKIFLEKQEGEIEVIDPGGAFYELNGHRAIINAGSVGLPRNRSRRASMAVLDTDLQGVHFEYFDLEDPPLNFYPPARKKSLLGKFIKRLRERFTITGLGACHTTGCKKNAG